MKLIAIKIQKTNIDEDTYIHTYIVCICTYMYINAVANECIYICNINIGYTYVLKYIYSKHIEKNIDIFMY